MMISNTYSPECLGKLLHDHVGDDEQVGLEVLVQILVLTGENLVVEKIPHPVEDGSIPYDEAVFDGLSLVRDNNASLVSS